MKKFILCLAIALSNIYNSICQDTLMWQSPLPAGHHYADVQVLNPNTMMGVANQGTFVRSDNGGSSWQYIYANTLSDLKGVFFTNSDTGYVVGASNYGPAPHIMKTADGGHTWDSLYTGYNADLYDVFFVDDSTGWICGDSGKIFKTVNGGLNWINQSQNTLAVLYSVFMLNPDTGFVAGQGGALYRTFDGGQNWNLMFPGTSVNIYDLYFVNYNFGWLCGDGETIRKSTDGGVTWTSKYFTGSSPSITSICFSDTMHGFACSQSYIYHTSNGSQWNDQNNFYNQPVAVDIDKSGKGIMAGMYGCIQQTTDSGLTWSSITGQSNFFHYEDLFFTDKTHGWCVGEGGKILKTTDGKSWTMLNSSTGSDLFDVHFVNNNTGYAVGESGTVRKTVNGGTSWTNINIPVSSTLYSVYFLNQNLGWTGGLSSTLYKTVNGGTTWSPLTLPNFVFNIDDIYFLNADTGYLACWQQQLYKTVNGGATWTSLALPNLVSDLMRIQFLNKDTGWASDSYGQLIRTYDGGATWANPLYQFCFDDASAMYFYDALHGYAAGGQVNWDCKLWKTNDGGVTWQNTHLPFAFDVKSLFMTDTNSVYLCGSYGNIIYYGDSLTAVISDLNAVEDDNELMVFPNPSKNIITISSRILMSEISITDITGRVLHHRKVNDEKYALDISNVNPGVYILSVKTDPGNCISRKVVVE